jgi:hypothetical protein
MRRLIQIGTAIGSFGLLLLSYGNKISNYLGILSLPDDVRKALIAMSEIPTLLAWAIFAVGLAAIAFLIYDTKRTVFSRIGRNRLILPIASVVFFGLGLGVSGVWLFKEYRARSASLSNIPAIKSSPDVLPASTQPRSPNKPAVGSITWKYNETKPLIEAAKSAYADTRTTFAGGLAESNDASADQIFLWYSYALINLAEIWGTRPPSEKLERLDLKGYKLTYDTQTISAPIPGYSVAYSDLRVAKDALQDAVEKIKGVSSKPSWVPEKLTVADPPKKPPEIKRDVVGRARFLYDRRSNGMALINKQDIEIVTIDRDTSPTAILVGQFIARFSFSQNSGPYDVNVTDSSDLMMQMPLQTLVLENEKNFVKLRFQPSQIAMVTSNSTEITVIFYRK